MPRKADALLEGRILDAAYPHLEQTRRTCSHHARRRRRLGYYNPDALRALFPTRKISSPCSAARARLNLFSASNPRGLRRRFAAAFSTSFWHIPTTTASSPKIGHRLCSKEEMPSFEFLKRSLAAQLGGKPDRRTPLALALVAVLHGTATLLHSVNIHQKISRDFRCACIRACDALIQAPSAKASHANRLP